MPQSQACPTLLTNVREADGQRTEQRRCPDRSPRLQVPSCTWKVQETRRGVCVRDKVSLNEEEALCGDTLSCL